MFIQDEIQKRKLPDLFINNKGEKVTALNFEERRKELVDILSREIYGRIPNNEYLVEYTEESNLPDYGGICVGKLLKIKVTDKTEDRFFEFDAHYYLPISEKKIPLVISIGFVSDTPNKNLPLEEILSYGVGVLHFGYNDITKDNPDKISGIGSIYTEEKYGIGKISMWAWGAIRALDAIYKDDRIDKNKIAVAGHSRLGKTATWAAANDSRFTYVFCNDAGGTGDALTRGNNGEQVKDVIRLFPYWYVKGYAQYVDKAYEMPFDQHFLLASIAPRHLATGNASLDDWADPKSEYLAIKEADRVWKMLGHTGLIAPDDRFPIENESFIDGSISNHLRYGKHFFSRIDWINYLKFFTK